LPLESHTGLDIMGERDRKHQHQSSGGETIMKLHFTSIFNRFVIVVALIAALVVSAVQVTPVQAASIVVNTSEDSDSGNTDDGKCTLREAIITANGPLPRGGCSEGSAGADSITFDRNYTITLSYIAPAPGSTPQLPFITSSITITGNGAANTIIQASTCNPVTLPGGCTPATYRVFQVVSTDTLTGNLTLDGVTVRHGRCNGLCTVQANPPIDPNAGGAIHNSGMLTVRNSIIRGNTGYLGGGIYNLGTLNVQNSTFSDNTATQGGADDGGGGIRNAGTLTVTGSTFSGNNSPGGGGILNHLHMTVINSTFSENTATYGAGILNGIYTCQNPNGCLNDATIENTIFSGNTAANQGGAMYSHWNSTVTVRASTFSNNTSPNGGGAVLNYGANVTITGSTFSENSSNRGGGIYNSTGPLAVTNSTFSGNNATDKGGGILNFEGGTLTLTNSTFSGNSAPAGNGGGIRNENTTTLINTIVANSTNGGNCSGTITNGGYNLDSGTSCGWGTNSGSKSSTNPMLGALTDNGGLTQTMALLAGSTAIDAVVGDVNCPTTDQRGVARPQRIRCDIGAYEYDVYNIVVNSAADPGVDDQLCTLREAITAANTNTATGGCPAGLPDIPDAIGFAGNYIITLSGSQLPTVTTDIGIIGKGTTNTIIQANASPNVASNRIFMVSATGTLTLNGVTLANGRCDGSCPSGTGDGGAIWNSGNLTIRNSILTGNRSAYGAAVYNAICNGCSNTATIESTLFSNNNTTAQGGAMYNHGTNTATVTNSTFLNNTGPGGGGALLNYGGIMTITGSTFSGNTAVNYEGGAVYNDAGDVTVTNSTFFGNSASQKGGAIVNRVGDGTTTLTVTNSTFSNNGASSGGGIYNAGTATLRNTILTNSTSGGNCAGTITNGGYNLDSATTCGFGSNNSSLSNTDPMLAPLADNAGPTQTMALLIGSPAMDTGDDTTCANIYVNNKDQRGVTRPQRSHCDIGAYEFIEPTFGDVSPSHPYSTYIEILYANGYTGGCSTSPLLFCPDTIMNRAQAAVFMVRGNFGGGYIPVTPTHIFADDWSNVAWAEGWAESMFLTGLSGGCSVSPRLFCPEEQLTNVQAAVFGLRMKYGVNYQPPAASGAMFADLTDVNFWGTSWAEQAYAEGLLPACGTSGGKPLFCPNSLVSRGFGASIIVKAKGLTMP
jgi:CSLREA domain-containing protein